MTTYDSKTLSVIAPSHNLNGWERALSIGAGLVMTTRGLRRGGIGGIYRAGLGGLLVLRGLRGHCSVKGFTQDPAEEIRFLSAELRRASNALSQLANDVEKNSAHGSKGKNGKATVVIDQVDPVIADAVAKVTN